MNEFGHKRPVRNVQGEIVGMAPAPAVRITRNNGPDGRKLVVSLCDGDLITLRESRTAKTRSITASDLWWHLIRCETNQVRLEKAREQKAKKAQRLADQRATRALRKRVNQI